MPDNIILTVEEAILRRLQAQIRDCKIAAFPANPEELGKPISSAQIFVGFRGERPRTLSNQVSNTTPIAQWRGLEFEVLLRTKDLRNHTGIYILAEQVNDSLSGLQVQKNSKPLLFSGSTPVEVNNGIWHYSQFFTFQTAYTKRVI